MIQRYKQGDTQIKYIDIDMSGLKKEMDDTEIQTRRQTDKT